VYVCLCVRERGSAREHASRGHKEVRGKNKIREEGREGEGVYKGGKERDRREGGREKESK